MREAAAAQTQRRVTTSIVRSSSESVSVASMVPAGNGCPFASSSIVNEPDLKAEPAMAARSVFAEEAARAGLAGAMTLDERFGGTDARGGPLGDEASLGRLVGTEAGATRAGVDEAATAALVD
jgi:hypothetical protein